MLSQCFLRTAARSSSAQSAHNGQFSALVMARTTLSSSAVQSTTQPTTSIATRSQSTLAPLRGDQPREQVLAPVYVHQISKTVLQHLQTDRHDWLQRTGLDRGLRLNANGTFVLQFPSPKGHDAGRIWCVVVASCLLTSKRLTRDSSRCCLSHFYLSRRVLTSVPFNAILFDCIYVCIQDQLRRCHEAALAVPLQR